MFMEKEKNFLHFSVLLVGAAAVYSFLLGPMVAAERWRLVAGRNALFLARFPFNWLHTLYLISFYFEVHKER